MIAHAVTDRSGGSFAAFRQPPLEGSCDSSKPFTACWALTRAFRSREIAYASQKAIVATARKLSDEGTIVLAGRGGEQMV